MKVVDMFGSQLPVCSMNYPTISELVEDRETGLLFRTSAELGQELWDLLEGFPASTTPLLKQMKKRLAERRDTWSENWNAVVWTDLNTRIE